MRYETVQREILQAALRHVPFDGWTERALAAGAEEAGHGSDMGVRAFPRGVPEALETYLTLLDARMADRIAEMDLAQMPIRARVAACVRARLEASASEKEAARLATAQLGLPFNAPIAVRGLYRTVDMIWYACGDRATDWNFYSKRALLAGVYSATLLYWLNDASKGNAASWAFLDRRIEGVMRLPKTLKRCQSLAAFPFGLLRAVAARPARRW